MTPPAPFVVTTPNPITIQPAQAAVQASTLTPKTITIDCLNSQIIVQFVEMANPYVIANDAFIPIQAQLGPPLAAAIAAALVANPPA